MKFAIRDDDTAFFTMPEELYRAYDFIKNGKISLSIVPMTVSKHKDSVYPYGKSRIDGKVHDIRDNIELIEYLKQNKTKYDFLLHGYDHQYKLVNGSWKAEMIWKSEDQLRHDISLGKEILEECLNQSISVFVAPNNMIDKKAIRVIEENSMDYSGIITKNDRDFSFRYCCNFVKRWAYRLVCGIPYPGVLNYGNHKELVAYTLDDYDRLVYEYHKCKKRNQPFVVYTHYWMVYSNPKTKELLRKIYEYVSEDGAELVGLSECFR